MRKAVWDTSRDRSIAHVGYSDAECRCVLQVTWDVQEIETALENKLTMAFQMKVLPPASAVIS